ncbi:MAG: ADOP family duplicated permease [Acidobacteriia bacterium]|nr:ADOP family duplicated permease [Terriglobia bacterium]
MNWLDSLRADAVFGWRQLSKRKVTSAAAIVSLALAMGASIAAFRLIDALLLRPLPVAGADRLYALSRKGFIVQGRPATVDGWEYPLLRDLRAAASPAELIAISYAEHAEVAYGSEIEKAHVQYVSGGMFGSFGLKPAVGSLFDPAGARPFAVLSHDYWTRRFGADRSVVGRALRLGGSVYEIAGVLAPGFTGTEPGTMVDIFLPAPMHWGASHDDWSVFRAFVHLPAGAAVAPIRDRLSAALLDRNERRGGDSLNQRLAMEPAAAGISGMQSAYRLSLAALAVLVALVLAIACANLANLMAARAAAREREMALRVSMGASRWRLAQLVGVEGALLAIAAASLGAVLAWWSAPFVAGRISPPENPVRLNLTADGRVIAFGFGLVFFVTLLLGMRPAARVWNTRLIETLSRRPPRGMGMLIAMQTALCFLVLFVASMFVSTFERLSHQHTGFSVERILNLDVATEKNQPAAVWNEAANRLRGVPGVEAAAYADWPLMDGYGFKFNAISVNGAPAGKALTWFLNVSPGWIETMKIPLIDGRDFRDHDLSPGAAIVNQAFARQYFDGANPIGKWFEGTSGYMRGQRFTIVGLVADARYRYLREEVPPVAYTPFHRLDAKGTMPGGTFVVRTSSSDPSVLAPVLRHEIPAVRPEFRVRTVRTQRELSDAQTIRERLIAMLALFFAAIALLLAGIGLYGVLDHSVVQRRREIGIRMALGARGAHIARVVTARIAAMVLAGALGGLVLGLTLAGYLRTLLYGVHPTDPAMLAIPSITVAAAVIAAAIPGVLRALRIDPAAMLRAE